MMLNDEALCAPVIMAPLVTGNFTIGCTERPLDEELRNNCRTMQRQAHLSRLDGRQLKRIA